MNRYIFTILIICLIASGCITTSENRKSNDQFYQTKIATLEKQVKDLQRQIDRLEAKKKNVRTGEEKFEILSEISKLSQKQQENLSYLEQIKKEISELKSNINKKHNYQKSKENNYVNNIKRRIYKKQSKYKPVKRKKVTSADDEYIKCYKLYVKSKFKESEQCFNRFLSRFPKSHLIANAYFWIGETYFARKNYPKAIDYYDIILTKFLKSEKVPAALLKEGLSFYELHDNEGAKIFLEKVISDYPKTPQAKWAKNYLKKYNLNNLR